MVNARRGNGRFEASAQFTAREEVRQAISHWAKEEVTLTSTSSLPSHSVGEQSRPRRGPTVARRGSKIVNLTAHRSGADSNCYVLLSCGRPFERVRREAPPTPEDSNPSPSLSHISAFYFPPLFLHRRARSLARFSKFASGVADRSSPITGINASGESIGITIPPSVCHSFANYSRWISLACI